MKGKITKDILLRVGKGVMRIPRSKDEIVQEPQRFSPDQSSSLENDKDLSSRKTKRS